MAAESVTGVGQGASNKLTTKELAILANGPSIFLSGYASSVTIEESSPPSVGNTVTFPQPLTGSHDNYVVLLTTINGGDAYVNVMTNNSDSNFISFFFITEFECDVMYIVASVGIRPIIN